MNSVEDQLRAAGRAVAGQVTSLPELRPAPKWAGSRARQARGGRRWITWAAPAAAMAVVVAVAVALAAVRGIGSGSTAVAPPPSVPSAAGMPPATSQVPAYYIAASLSEAARDARAIVGDLRTGKQVATITPPAGHALVGVAGAADGSAFVLDMPQAGTPHEFYLYRPASAGSAPRQRSRLMLTPSLAGEDILGLALSPDGSRLAVLSLQRGSGLTDTEAVRIYSTGTGKVQREWTMPAPSSVGWAGNDNSHSLDWTDNGQAVAFRRDIGLAEGEFGVSVFILGVNRPGNDLRADSRIVSVQANDNGCKSMLVTPDGETVLCGVESWGGPAAACPRVHPAVTEFSAQTGQLIGVLYEYRGPCTWGEVNLYWSNSSGTGVVANLLVDQGTRPVDGTFLFGPRGYTELPVRLPGGTDLTDEILNYQSAAAF